MANTAATVAAAENTVENAQKYELYELSSFQKAKIKFFKVHLTWSKITKRREKLRHPKIALIHENSTEFVLFW